MSRLWSTGSLLAALGCAAAVAMYVVYTWDPAVATFFPHCAFHDLTGLQCPGCGATRALHELLHGRLIAAFRYNRLLVLAAPLLIAAISGEARSHLSGAPPPGVLRRPWIGWTIAATLALWWIVRNLMQW